MAPEKTQNTEGRSPAIVKVKYEEKALFFTLPGVVLCNYSDNLTDLNKESIISGLGAVRRLNKRVAAGRECRGRKW
jgi:hypothetical protein